MILIKIIKGKKWIVKLGTLLKISQYLPLLICSIETCELPLFRYTHTDRHLNIIKHTKLLKACSTISIMTNMLSSH